MRISRSRYETFMDCPFKYHNTYNLGLAPRIMGEPLRKGRAAHKFLEAWYNSLELPLAERRKLAFEALDSALSDTRHPIAPTQAEDKLLQETEGLMQAYL